MSLTCVSFAKKDKGRPNDTIHIRLYESPETLDWSKAGTVNDLRVIENIMEGLVRINEDLKPVPVLAKKWEISEDGKKYVFHIKKGVKWSDGKELVSDDFIYSWRRLIDPKIKSDFAYYLFDIVNAEKYYLGKIKDPTKIGIKKIDRFSFEVSLVRPARYFIQQLGFGGLFPLRGDIVRKYGSHWTDPGKIVTLGPYLLKKREKTTVEIEYNPRYGVKKPPQVRRAIFYNINDKKTALKLFEAGKLDIVFEVSTDDIVNLGKIANFKAFPYLSFEFLTFNTRKPPFDDVVNRKAFASILDRKKIVSLYKSGELPTKTLLMKGMPGYDANMGIGFDPIRGNRLKGKKKFPRVRLCIGAVKNSELGKFIKESAARYLDMKVDLKLSEMKVVYDDLSKGKCNIGVWGWIMDYPDPHNIVGIFTSNSGNNYTGFKNDNYDKLVKLASSTSSPSQRNNLYKLIMEIVLQRELIVVPLFTQKIPVILSKRIHNVAVSPMDNIYLKEIKLLQE